MGIKGIIQPGGSKNDRSLIEYCNKNNFVMFLPIEDILNIKEIVMKIQLKLENIGPITKAKVNLKNLSIIVGANSIGKSLISKTAYILLRGLNLNDENFIKLLDAEAYKPQLYSDSTDIFVFLSINDEERLNVSFNPLKIQSKFFSEIKAVTYVGEEVLL